MIWFVLIGVMALGALIWSITQRYERQMGRYYSPAKDKKKNKKEGKNVA